MNEQNLKNAVNNIQISEEMKNRILEKAKICRKDGKCMKSKKKRHLLQWRQRL